jgi:hypothetical protein
MVESSGIDFTFAYSFIIGSCVVGFLYGLWNLYSVLSISTEHRTGDDQESPLMGAENNKTMNEISRKIQNVIIYV